MTRWFTLLALVCFVPQQFTCCAESCTAGADHARETPRVEQACGHCTHHDEDSPADPEHSSHHLCVATHLFYVARGDSHPPVTDVVDHLRLVPAFETIADAPAPLLVAATIPAGPPPDPRRERSVLSVWIL